MKIKKKKKETFKNILILGYGKTGKSIAEFLKNKKFNIYFWDDNSEVFNKISNNFFKYNKQSLNIFQKIFTHVLLATLHIGNEL